MEPNAPVDEAKRIIGTGAPDDYVIAPTEHSERLRSEAPELCKILDSSAVATEAAQYEKRDKEAMAARDRFKRTAVRAYRALLLGAFIGSVLLMLAVLDIAALEPRMKWINGGLGLLALIVSGGSAALMFRLRRGELLKRWMKARAKAEMHRLEYFRRVACKPDDSGDRDHLPLLQLEYFRRYQLDVQIAFYEQRGSDHHKSADKTLDIATAATIVSSVATGVAGIVASWAPKAVAVAGFGMWASALASYATARESIYQDGRNAERYDRVLESLEQLKKRLDDVRRKVAQGETEVLTRFVEAVNDQLSLEHREWLDSTEAASASIERLRWVLDP